MKIQKFTPQNHKVKALVYGASGSGKTSFGGTTPKPIFASAEGGLLSISDKSPDFVDIKSLQDLKDLYKFLKTEKHEYETIVIDSITEINDIIKQELEQKNKGFMQLKDWGVLARDIKNIFRSFRDLPMHVLFIAQEATEKDEEKIQKIIPSLNGKASTEIAYYMDIVGYLFVDKTGERKMYTSQNSRTLSKDRTSKIGDNTNVDFGEWINLINN